MNNELPDGYGGAGDAFELDGFQKEFNIKTAFGPKDETGQMRWSRCWSDVPKIWAPAIHTLLGKIRAKYHLETVEDDPNNPNIQVVIEQIKLKFGSLRFYHYTCGLADAQEKEINTWIEECEGELAKLDPFYGIPY